MLKYQQGDFSMAENTRALVLFDEKNRFYYTSFLSSFGFEFDSRSSDK